MWKFVLLKCKTLVKFISVSLHLVNSYWLAELLEWRRKTTTRRTSWKGNINSIYKYNFHVHIYIHGCCTCITAISKPTQSTRKGMIFLPHPFYYVKAFLYNNFGSMLGVLLPLSENELRYDFWRWSIRVVLNIWKFKNVPCLFYIAFWGGESEICVHKD